MYRNAVTHIQYSFFLGSNVWTEISLSSTINISHIFLSKQSPQSPVSTMYADEKHSYPVILWAKDYLQLSKHAQSEKAIHVTQLQFLTQTLCSINT